MGVVSRRRRLRLAWRAARATVAESLAARLSIRAQIIWAKERLVIGRGDYHWQHEPCWYAVAARAIGPETEANHAMDDRKWRPGHRNAHGTQKPVECMRRPILNNSVVGEAIYDPFLGSGRA